MEVIFTKTTTTKKLFKFLTKGGTYNVAEKPYNLTLKL